MTTRRFSRDIPLALYGVLGGGTRRLVACSNAYAISIKRGSWHALLVKVAPTGIGFASNPANVSWRIEHAPDNS